MDLSRHVFEGGGAIGAIAPLIKAHIVLYQIR